jgi:hypothetical protein
MHQCTDQSRIMYLIPAFWKIVSKDAFNMPLLCSALELHICAQYHTLSRSKSYLGGVMSGSMSVFFSLNSPSFQMRHMIRTIGIHLHAQMCFQGA